MTSNCAWAGFFLLGRMAGTSISLTKITTSISAISAERVLLRGGAGSPIGSLATAGIAHQAITSPRAATLQIAFFCIVLSVTRQPLFALRPGAFNDWFQFQLSWVQCDVLHA